MARRNLYINSSDSEEEMIPDKSQTTAKKAVTKSADDDEYNPFSANYVPVKAHKVEQDEDEESSDFEVGEKEVKQHKQTAYVNLHYESLPLIDFLTRSKQKKAKKPAKKDNDDKNEDSPRKSPKEIEVDTTSEYNPFLPQFNPKLAEASKKSKEAYVAKEFGKDINKEVNEMRRALKDTFDSISDLLDFIDTDHEKFKTLRELKRQVKLRFSELKTYKTNPESIKDIQSYLSKCDQLCYECSQYNYETLSEKKRVYSPKSPKTQNDSERDNSDDESAPIFEYSSDDEYEFATDLVKLKRQCAKEVDQLIFNDSNAPNGQACIPLNVQQGEVIAFTWKEQNHSRLLFGAMLTQSKSNITIDEVVPVQYRITKYQMIYSVPFDGVLKLLWDNRLSIRKGKQINIWVKKFRGVDAQIVLEDEKRRNDLIREKEIEQLNKGAYEGGQLTCKLTSRTQTVDGVKYVCHCDWEAILTDLKVSWDVAYPYKQWYQWYQLLYKKYYSHIKLLPPFPGTAFMTTQAVIDERLSKINDFLQELLTDSFLMKTAEVNNWLEWSEHILRVKKQAYEEMKKKNEKEQEKSPLPLAEPSELSWADSSENENAQTPPPPPEEAFDPLSYLCN